MSKSSLVRALVVVWSVTVSWTWAGAQRGGPAVAIDPDDIGGTVTSSKGPEAGVWVVAETTELPTRFTRIVVTDDQGRYVIPDLPRANYQVFVRGYGLVDSPRQVAKPGQHLDLKAEIAPSAAAAAQYYPAAYWLALMTKPVASCALACHSMGTKGTREIPQSILAKSSSSLDAWTRRMGAGPEAARMSTGFARMGADRQLFADWTDRIAKGEIPKTAPSRPTGVERNLVISWWDWGTKLDGRTDAAASDARSAGLNANGKIYMVAQRTDTFAVLDPVENQTQFMKVPSKAPVVAANTPWSAYWGDEPIWKRQAEPRSVAMDERGRVWLTARLREKPGLPSFCTSSTNKFAKYFSATHDAESKDISRGLVMFDPKTQKFTPIADTCFTLDHNQLGPDGLFYFGSDNAVWWFDPVEWDKTHNAEASQGWCPAVLDTNGDGTITEWTEPGTPVDPKKDRRLTLDCYMVAVDPINKNGVAWCGSGQDLIRVERGPTAPQSCKAEVYRPPTGVVGASHAAVDEQGVVWTNWRGSQHLTSFDRRKCKSTKADPAGQGCPEGWSVHLLPAPTYEGTNIQAEMTYLSQVDRYGTLGLGKNTPTYGTVNTDMLVAFSPETNEFVKLRVPYPQGFFSRSANGRIDNPNTGWKGKGLWSSFSTYIPWHVEGKDGHGQKAVKFQIRPSPLAK